MPTRREFLSLALGGSAAALVTQRIMRRPVSPRITPTIAISILPQYRASVPSPDKLIRICRKFTDVYGPIWGVNANFIAIDHPIEAPNVWNFIFAEDAQACEGALAYHDWDATKSYNPYALVEVPTILADHGEVTVGMTHELAEMLADPGCNYWADAVPLTDSDISEETALAAAKLLAYETADPVEDPRFAWKIDGFPVTDFVYPAYFEPYPDGRFDHTGAIHSAHEIAIGGYQLVRSTTSVSQVVNIGFGPDQHRVTTSQDPCVNEPDRRLCHRARRIMSKWRLLNAQISTSR